MSWCFEANDSAGSNAYFTGFADRQVFKLVPALCRSNDPRAGSICDLNRAGNVIVVDVGFQNVQNPKLPGRSEFEETPCVSLRIDEDRFVSGINKVTVIAQTRSNEKLPLKSHINNVGRF